jgi:hypothetical protein
VAVVALGGIAVVPGSAAARHGSPSINRAYRFLDHMTDRQASGRTPRLVQSFIGGKLGRDHFTDSETYDDALLVIAYLARGQRADLRRAKAIGAGLLRAQRNDPAGDGRLRVAYRPGAVTAHKKPRITSRTSDVGNMAWVGISLAMLAKRTDERRYLAGARRIGRWVVSHSWDTRGAGGFTGGKTASGTAIRWKSTEHNVDLYALFTMLRSETGQHRWAVDAVHARAFVIAMWNPKTHAFWVGTGSDGTSLNKDDQPEDVNSWTYLALRDATYRKSIDWDTRHLAVQYGRFSGTSFCEGDRSGVWFEGTAHLAEALKERNGRGDAKQAAAYLADIRRAQAHGPGTDGDGVIAASKDGLRDCDGDHYFASLHTGATAWYLLAAQGVNPFIRP